MPITIRLMYIDDDADLNLSFFIHSFELKDFLKNNNLNENVCISVSEYHLKKSDSFDALIKTIKDNQVNILIIDSKLYEDKNVLNKITGEAVKLYLKQFLPYIEVIVISSKEIDENYLTISKSFKSSFEDAKSQYNNSLLPKIVESIKKVQENLFLAEEMKKGLAFDKYISDRIEASLNFREDYSSITKNDIDDLIDAFKAIQEKIDEL